RIKRLALGVADETLFRLGRIGSRPRAAAELAEHAERIAGVIHAGVGAALGLAVDRTVHADLPGRPMSGQRILLVLRNRIVAHAGEKIVGLIVLARVRHAESPVFVLTQPALRRPMGA